MGRQKVIFQYFEFACNGISLDLDLCFRLPGAQTRIMLMRHTLLALAVTLAAPRPAATFAPSFLRSARAGGAPLPKARHAAVRSISSSPVLRMSGGGYVGDAKLKELGIELPTVAAAAANYVRTTPRHVRV